MLQRPTPPHAVTDFDDQMTAHERILGWVYLPTHVIALPVLLSVLVYYHPIDGTTVNIFYYLLGLGYLGLAMGGWFRAQFDSLLDHPQRSLLTVATGYLAYWALSIAVAVMLLLFQNSLDGNPNNDLIQDITGGGYGPMRGIGIFIVPLIEEPLFRGIVYGSLRRRHKILAYTASIVAFAIYHVWQYVVISWDVSYFLYALQYIPAGAILAWTYEYSQSIWCPIFLHMLLNYIAFQAMTLL